MNDVCPFLPALLTITTDQSKVGESTIDMLTDDVLLHIFRLYLNHREARRRKWHKLIHVCQRWRSLVLVSPYHLGLQLEFTGKRPITEMLDVWPPFPITIRTRNNNSRPSERYDNILAALNSKHYDRVCEITLDISTWDLERIVTTLQKSFPELTHLDVSVYDDDLEPVLPDSFLAGSAPRLQNLSLDRVSFPAMQKLLLSANDLVSLCLLGNPDSRCVSPEMMATCLSAMSRLKYLSIDFQSRQCHPHSASRCFLPANRSVLPALASFEFDGASTYLEGVVAHINAPRLQCLHIHFFTDLLIHAPQLHRFISDAEDLNKPYEASMYVSIDYVEIELAQPMPADCHKKEFVIIIPFAKSYRPLSSIAHVFRSYLPRFSTLERLVINDCTSRGLPLPAWNDYDYLLDLLYPFAAVKDLCLYHEIGLHVGYALRQLTEEGSAAEVLPMLQNIFIKSSESSVQEEISGFAAERNLSGHPVAVRHVE
jgi:hypothetical protein